MTNIASFVVAALAIAGLAILPLLGEPYWTTFVFSVLIAYVLAQSWDWVAGEMGYINLGHYVFYGVGAYAFAIALTSALMPSLASSSAAVSAIFIILL